MPKGDRTGPYGMGPATGRGAGFCGGNSTPGYMNPGPGMGMGGGRGRRQRGFGGNRFGGWGPGNGWRFNPLAGAEPAVDQEKEILKQQVEILEKSLQQTNKRLQELEKDKSQDE